jgi:hypothetical protein
MISSDRSQPRRRGTPLLPLAILGAALAVARALLGLW